MAGPIHGPDEREENRMSYADGLLSTGERIELRERQHWFILVWAGRWAIFAIIGALILGFLAFGLDADGISGTIRTLASLIFVVLLVGGIASVAWEALRYRHQEYVITNRRVMQVGGVINKHSTDSSLEKINDAALSQSHLRADVRVRRPRRPDRVGERDRALPDDPGPDRVQEGDARREARVRAGDVARPGSGQPAAARGARSAARAKPGARPGRDILGQRPAAASPAASPQAAPSPATDPPERKCHPTR